jgi:predicted nucleic acid-binding protein
MDAAELLRSDDPFVCDTSAWWRTSSLPDELGALRDAALQEDRMWITPIVRMEILYSARSASEYVALPSKASWMLCESCATTEPWRMRP